MSDNLASDIESDIIFGVYGPGTRLTEDRIIERYDVKRHVVRAAFTALEQRGLLVHQANRGVEVVEFTPDQVDELYQVRIILETSAAKITPLPVSASIIKQMEQLANEHKQAIKDEDFRQVFALNKRFHEVQFSCCPNERLRNLIKEHTRIAQPIRVVKYDDGRHMSEVVAQHYEIIEAMKGPDQSAYVAATRKHLPASAEAYRKLFERRFARTG